MFHSRLLAAPTTRHGRGCAASFPAREAIRTNKVRGKKETYDEEERRKARREFFQFPRKIPLSRSEYVSERSKNMKVHKVNATEIAFGVDIVPNSVIQNMHYNLSSVLGKPNWERDGRDFDTLILLNDLEAKMCAKQYEHFKTNEWLLGQERVELHLQNKLISMMMPTPDQAHYVVGKVQWR